MGTPVMPWVFANDTRLRGRPDFSNARPVSTLWRRTRLDAASDAKSCVLGSIYPPLHVVFAYRAPAPDQETRVFRKFVLITGGLDIPIGLATIAAALLEPRDAHFGALMTCGAFLVFAGAALLWSAADLKVRAPIVFWQAFVRLTAVGSILYMVPAGLAESWQYGVVAFDGVIALVYIVGSLQYTGAGFFGLLMGKGAA